MPPCWSHCGANGTNPAVSIQLVAHPERDRMADAGVKPADLAEVEKLVAATDAVVTAALDAARRTTDGGKNIDDAQVHCERLAYAATEVAVAKELLAYARAAHAHAERDPVINEMAAVFAAETAQRLHGNLDAHAAEFGLGEALLNRTLGAPAIKASIRDA